MGPRLGLTCDDQMLSWSQFRFKHQKKNVAIVVAGCGSGPQVAELFALVVYKNNITLEVIAKCLQLHHTTSDTVTSQRTRAFCDIANCYRRNPIDRSVYGTVSATLLLPLCVNNFD